jgi:hypothetical protein
MASELSWACRLEMERSGNEPVGQVAVEPPFARLPRHHTKVDEEGSADELKDEGVPLAL